MTNNHDDRAQRAVELFMQGYGCCQSVVAAFADRYGLSDEMAKRVSAGFGGGVGRMRMMCGAVSGLVILAGLEESTPPQPSPTGEGEAKSPSTPDAAQIRENKAHCYKVVQELLAKSKEENGSLICAELLGLKGEIPMGNFVPDERNADYYKRRPCAAKVESAARIFAQYLAEKQA